jgi:hypothetical protein
MIIAAAMVAWKAAFGLLLIANRDMRRKQLSYVKQ